jgi:DNA-binding HxlR family transcriptional regulator
VRFTGLRKAVPGVTAQVLTRSLRALERDGIVVRRYFPQVPPCVEYGLTDLGVTLCEPVGAIRAWAEKHGEAILTARQRFEHRKAAD